MHKYVFHRSLLALALLALVLAGLPQGRALAAPSPEVTVTTSVDASLVLVPLMRR